MPQQHYERIEYEDIYYGYLGRESHVDDNEPTQEYPFQLSQVHQRDHNILFREFVHILVWMAHSLDPHYEKPQKAIEKLMAKITPFLDTISKGQKSAIAGSENMSENKSSVSKAEKNLSPFYRSTNAEVFKALLLDNPQLRSRTDETLKIRELLGYGMLNGCIGEAELGLLERIIEKYFDTDLLTREKKACW